jgi:hypothetical protein
VAQGALNTTTDLTPEDLGALLRAVRALEHTSLAARLTAVIGRQIGLVGRLMPAHLATLAANAAEAALRSALHLALRSLSKKPAQDSRRLHKAMAALSGAAGGAFGVVSLPIELPLSTAIMLRSIADIARKEGEDLSSPEAVLACLQVFALGGRSETDDYMESGYFAIRGLLAKSVTEASSYLLERSVADEAAPVLVRFLAEIGSRFGIVISQKLAAQTVPLVGAAGGAAINIAFINHFQSLAHGHFTVRRLERLYGVDRIRAEYARLLNKLVGDDQAATA